jgi:hypothetical protein
MSFFKIFSFTIGHDWIIKTNTKKANELLLYIKYYYYTFLPICVIYVIDNERGEDYTQDMKFLIAALTALFLSLFLVGFSYADNNCTTVQKHNGGSVNSNCNNNSNSQSQSQTQDNNQSVNVTVGAVQSIATVTTLPSTGPVDGVLFTLLASFPLGVFLRKKA